MKLKFIAPSGLDKNIKATAHRSGKLGFSAEAALKLKLDINKYASIAINEEDANDKNLYVILSGEKKDDTFTISKAGAYYYLNAKALFDNLKVDYVKDSVVYDIKEDLIDGQQLYNFKRREKEKKQIDIS